MLLWETKIATRLRVATSVVTNYISLIVSRLSLKPPYPRRS
jgi:hypothetical protein